MHSNLVLVGWNDAGSASQLSLVRHVWWIYTTAGFVDVSVGSASPREATALKRLQKKNGGSYAPLAIRASVLSFGLLLKTPSPHTSALKRLSHRAIFCFPSLANIGATSWPCND